MVCALGVPKAHQELDLESLQLRRWFRKPCSQRNSAFNTRNVDKVLLFKIKQTFCKNIFL